MEGYCPLDKVGKDSKFMWYNNKVNDSVSNVASHIVITDFIKENGTDYRYEDGEHPVEALRDRKHDNTEVGRCK